MDENEGRVIELGTAAELLWESVFFQKVLEHLKNIHAKTFLGDPLLTQAQRDELYYQARGLLQLEQSIEGFIKEKHSLLAQLKQETENNE